MKIPLNRSDIKCGFIETNNLPDADAMVLEKFEELRTLCYKLNYRFVATVEQR